MAQPTASTPSLLPETQRRTPFERTRDRLAGTVAQRLLWRWLGPLLVTLLAGFLRVWNLAHPNTLVFDETYYVKDAWSLWNLGYEGKWPEGADELFLAGHVDAFTTDPAFVVHPPLGKWLIGLGMAGLGPDSGWGWRIATALAGTLAVLLVILIVRRMTGSTWWGCLAGFFLAVDGLGIVLSRVALLDGLLMLFVLLAFWFLVLDRERTAAEIARRSVPDGDGADPWGPVLWNRPWVLAAGAALGAACAVKWSAAWVLAAFGLYLVVSDAFLRRRAGVQSWQTAAIVRQGPVSFILLVPIAVVVYLASWTGWLVTQGGYDRGSDPNPFIALWNFHQAIYNFHVGLSSAHSYSSPAWQWPLMLRPTSMHWTLTNAGEDGCAFASGCAQSITSIANPAVWYPAVLAVIVLAILFALRQKDGAVRDWRVAIVLTAIAATYVPWLLYPERTIFQFYTVVMIPFLVIALALAAQRVAGRAEDTFDRRVRGQGLVAVLVIAVVVFAAFWLPLWWGLEIPYDFWRLHAPFDLWI